MVPATEQRHGAVPYAAVISSLMDCVRKNLFQQVRHALGGLDGGKHEQIAVHIGEIQLIPAARISWARNTRWARPLPSRKGWSSLVEQ